jgi:hypothetical protein
MMGVVRVGPSSLKKSTAFNVIWERLAAIVITHMFGGRVTRHQLGHALAQQFLFVGDPLNVTSAVASICSKPRSKGLVIEKLLQPLGAPLFGIETGAEC